MVFLAIEQYLFTSVLILYVVTMLLYVLYMILKKETVSRIALIVQIVGLVLHTLAILFRGIGAGRLPLTNQYEFATAFAWGISLVSLIFILIFKPKMLIDADKKYRREAGLPEEGLTKSAAELMGEK